MSSPDRPAAHARTRKRASRHRRRRARAHVIRPLLAAAVVLTASATAWAAMWLSARPDAVTSALPEVTRTVVHTTAVARAATTTHSAAPARSSSPAAAPPTSHANPTEPRLAPSPSPTSTSPARPTAQPTGSLSSTGSASVTGRQASVRVSISTGTPVQVTVTAHFIGPNGSQPLTLASDLQVSGTATVTGTTTLPVGATSWTYSIQTPDRVMTSAPAALG